ncbi:MAG: elongation factor P maturation arginine rhamnosyltransferase EarP [Burkholderiales bacterium]|nr:MAG: elongation factor P maturation arginine rhamnosyltransferase EarP [Burkholderiales bacterium]
MRRLTWDIFCRVIDNFGDIGVCWRLSSELASRGQAVRLWVDDASALAWMAPNGCSGVEVGKWQPNQPMPSDTQPGDVVVEAFGCEIDDAWIAMNSAASPADSMTANSSKSLKNTAKNPVWINLEYLSAESYAAHSHGLPSPVMAGAALGMTKWFFYPGFTKDTGGLIREPDGFSGPEPAESQRRISLFCYEPPALNTLMERLASSDLSTELLVMPGRGQKAVQAIIQSKNAHSPSWNMRKQLSINERAYMPQPQYDQLLYRCDLNFVRGEDSLVRALWAGRAFVWQIYPQQDGAHAAKLEAFLDWLQAPPDLRQFHRVWNGLSRLSLPPIEVKAWQECALAARNRLLTQRDLVSQLLDFVEEKRNLGI